MNTIIIVVILNILLHLCGEYSSIDLNYSRYRLKNVGLRFLVFKKKNVPIILKKFKNFYNACYNKSIASVGEGVCEFNNLSDEDKTIIETILSLCY